MSESPDGTDSVGDPNDDGQLTIRIPNPKMFMARQSQWKGRRGKPRCDHCRMNNLKCDRVLPTCNHCSYANGRDCRYTPLPTPAHRGIPRCDRCRLRNLKCDRNLPVCNHCAEEESATECNYTPKKRHKVPSDHGMTRDKQMVPYTTKMASFLVSDVPSPEEHTVFVHNGHNEPGDGHSFYGQNVASSSRSRGASNSPVPYIRGGSQEAESSLLSHLGRFTPDYNGQGWPSSSGLQTNVPRTQPNSFSFISHSFPPDQGMSVTKPLVESWGHPSFAPLPDAVLQRIRNVNSVEMPSRASFEDSLAKFLHDLPPDLRETAAFASNIYVTVSHALSKGSIDALSDRLRMWLTIHHVRLGSEKHHLLMLLRDSFFHLDAVEEEKFRQDYIKHIDDLGSPSSKADTVDHDFGGFEWTSAFERIPVQDQIYDILVYAHRAHSSSSSMLFETRRMGMATITWPMVEMFVRLCPLCNLRSKSGHGVKLEPTASPYNVDQISQ
ncbi:hypothetical protein K503DRAFT_707106 [Rhizopogon vinicolor AM-OR11-026]|uniref:Zn(2)-C6 fungal-type domain-containing protein n=1 Tax=Rhizopogon vinicolor AM-OR11-026 TaxID=1314800 RepID=A0A1B7NH04_9AGAM|nr:hypothetical protein K503DRAFT_707106 [Rhizopogon vinicolor AM-OR11-026]